MTGSAPQAPEYRTNLIALPLIGAIRCSALSSLDFDLDSANPFGHEVVNQRPQHPKNKPRRRVDQWEEHGKARSQCHETDTLLRGHLRRKCGDEKEEWDKQKAHDPVKNRQHFTKLQGRDPLNSSFGRYRWLVHRFAMLHLLPDVLDRSEEHTSELQS